MLKPLILSLVTVFGINEASALVTERVNCAGALSRVAGRMDADELYQIGDRSVRVLITTKNAFERPPSGDYLELPMADDRVPTFSTRIIPFLRQWRSRGREVIPLTLSPGEDLTSEKIKSFAENLTERGYTEASLAKRDFDVRLGTMQFTGREFWTSLDPAARRGQYVSVNAERGFNARAGFFREVTVPQALTWATRGLFVGTLASVGLHLSTPSIPLDQIGWYSTAAMFLTSTLATQVDAFSETSKAIPWFRPVHRLVLMLPDLRGLFSTARLASVMDRRARVLTDNMADALARYPDISMVQIVAHSEMDVPRLKDALKTHFAKAHRDELAREELTWTDPDPRFGQFPSRLRYKPLNFAHRPTQDLVDSLKVTFAPKRFNSVEDFISYYRPERTPTWYEALHDWSYQQYVAIYLFDSLRWSLPQFFALNPSPEQIRRLMDLAADHFDRGQLHEFPSGNAVLGTLGVIAAETERRYEGDEDARTRALVNFRTLPAAEYEMFARQLASPGRARAFANSYGEALRPMPAAFAKIPGNLPPLTEIKPDLETFPIPADGW